jgi:uncharacterized protein YjdB
MIHFNRMKGMLRALGIVIVCVFVCGIQACSEKDDVVKNVLVKSIAIEGSNIQDGGTSQMIAKITPDNAKIQEVIWSVSDETIASISSAGLLTAIKNGNVLVNAKATDESGVSKSRLIMISGVTVPPTLVESISISGSDITDGKTSQLTVTILPQNASTKTVEWSVSDATIAKISDSGLLTAINNGTVTVTATAKDSSGKSAIKEIKISGVAAPTVFVTNISVSGSDITDGASTQLTAAVLPANATNLYVTWSVSNVSIASISEQGLLYPYNNGTITVTATAADGSGVSGQITINISGVNTNIDGTVVSTSTELLTALNSVLPGGKIYVRGGEYKFTSTISLSKKGSSGSMISLLAHPNDATRPKFDFSSMSESSSNRGMSVSGSYWHVKGIDIFGAGDNGIFMGGSNNIIEFCSFSENRDTGLQIGSGAKDNLVLNCDSYFNADSKVENADGFACKLDAGTGNKFVGCRAWQNLDDGWDGYLRGTNNITTTYENCWAIRNGILKDGLKGGGDGNGFKTGGSDGKDLKHNAVYKNCIAAGNVFDGFDHNSNRGDVTLYNCASHSNGNNINFSSGNIANSLTIKNSYVLAGGSSSYNATTTDITNNGWQDGLTVSDSDFTSVSIDLLLSPRKADGSLPDIDYLKLVSGSGLIDKGVDVGLPFKGAAPDLGPFER